MSAYCTEDASWKSARLMRSWRRRTIRTRQCCSPRQFSRLCRRKPRGHPAQPAVSSKTAAQPGLGPCATRTLRPGTRPRAVPRSAATFRPRRSARMQLADATGFVFDVDGTLVLSDDPNSGSGAAQLLPGACDVLRCLRSRRTRYVCFTNGTGQVPRAVAAKLRGVGLDGAAADRAHPAT